jgi:kynureninase
VSGRFFQKLDSVSAGNLTRADHCAASGRSLTQWRGHGVDAWQAEKDWTLREHQVAFDQMRSVTKQRLRELSGNDRTLAVER